MSKLSNAELVKSEFENSDSEIQKPRRNRDACSTRYSDKTRSKFLHHQQDDESEQVNSSALKRPFSQKRREQNKQSAKKCRMRKKQRCVELEKYQKELQAQLLKLQQQHLKAKALLEKEISGNNTPIVFNTVGRTQAYQRLNKIIDSGELMDEDEINLILDNLRNRVGATGSERQGKITYIFKQIIHLSFPALHRYLMWAAKDQLDYFGNSNTQKTWTSSLSSLIGLNQAQQQTIKNKKSEFRQQFDTFSQLITEMKETKQKIEVESQKLQDIIQYVRHILTPTQCVRFLTFIESNKYKLQMELWLRKNMYKLAEDTTSPPATDPGVTKRPKFQGM